MGRFAGNSPAPSFWCRYEDAQTCLTIGDRGRGFDPAAPRNARAIGLDSMAERASQLGGTLLIESALGQGTMVRVAIPARRKN